MKYPSTIVLGLLLGTVASTKLDGIFALSQSKILEEEMQRKQAEQMVA